MKEIENGIITETFLGIDTDTEKLQFHVRVSGYSRSCVVGLFDVCPVGSPPGQNSGRFWEAIRDLLLAAGADRWESLRGKYVRIEWDGGLRMPRIANIYGPPRWWSAYDYDLSQQVSEAST